MKRMKRILALGLLALGINNHTLGSEKKLRIVTTTADLASIARAMGSEAVVVEHLAKPLQNPHTVEPKPSLVLTLMKADVFIQTGLELEIGWAPVLLRQSGNKRIQVGAPGHIDASDAVHPKEIPANPTRAMGDVHPGGNPHYMLDPENARHVARHIAQKLAELVPERRALFEENRTQFEKQLDQKMLTWEKELAPLKNAPYISYHRDWIYFTDRFGLRCLGEIEPKPGIPPTASHTNELIEKMKSNQIKLLLTDPWYEMKSVEFLAAASGAQIAKMIMMPGADANTPDYISMMDRNVKQLLAATGLQ